MGRRTAGSVVLGLAVVLGVCSFAQSGVIRDDRDPQSYLNLGNSALWESVGRVDITTSSASYLASGTLIAPDWVLTAAHVVQGARSLDFTVGGITYPAVGWVMNSKFTSGNLGAGNDIGLIHLGAPVAGIAPATRYTGSSELGTTAVAAGFGMTGTGLTGATTLDFQKRAGENTVDAFYPVRRGTPNILLMDFDNPHTAADNSYGSSAPLNLEYLIAPGDSGGGLFADFGSGPRLIGVHSFGWGRLDGNPDSDYGDVSGETRVSVFNSWIDNAMSGITGGKKGGPKGAALGLNAAEYEYGFFDNLTAVPEPGTLILLALAGSALRRKRRAQ